MNFNTHSNLVGKHAFLGASKYHWINYDVDKLRETYMRSLAVERGTRLHALASELIEMSINLPKKAQTLNLFVNDAIGYRMKSEQVLFYSENCFGTADAISFRKKLLRIHDLKTGTTPAHMEQLLIYAALFCLEYGVKPESIKIELRIYQNDEIQVYVPESEEVVDIMDKIIVFDQIISEMREKEDA